MANGGVHYAGKNLNVGGASDFNAQMSGWRDKDGLSVRCVKDKF